MSKASEMANDFYSRHPKYRNKEYLIKTLQQMEKDTITRCAEICEGYQNNADYNLKVCEEKIQGYYKGKRNVSFTAKQAIRNLTGE